MVIKKVIFILPTLSKGGGAERAIVQFANALFIKGYNVEIIAQYNSLEIYKPLCPYHYIFDKHPSIFLRIINIIKTFLYLKNYILENKITNLFSTLHPIEFISIFLKLFFKKKLNLGILIQNSYEVTDSNKVLTLLYKYIKKSYKYSDYLIGCSKCVSQEHLQNININKKKVITIYNPATIDEYIIKSKEVDENKKRTYRLINIGRLSFQKNHTYLINSYNKIINKTKFELLILGDGEDKEKLNTLIKNYNLLDNIKLVGIKKNVFPYIKSSDLFIFTSKFEGFSLALVEVLSQGILIISTDCKCGPRELLAPELSLDEKIEYPYFGKYGILIENQTEENSIRHKEMESLLGKLLDNIDNIKNRYKKEDLVKRAYDFDISNIIKDFENIL